MAYFNARSWLRRLRQSKDLPQMIVALNAGMSQGMYSRIELGYANPSKEQIAAISGALGITCDEFNRMDAAAKEEAKRRGVAKVMP